MNTVHTTALTAYPLFRRGKVRDVYDLGDRLLMVATDRISAFDVVMDETIPEKGALLTQISRYWFETLGTVVPNHILSYDVDALEGLTDEERAMLRGRSMIVRKTRPLPVECVVRGYLAGSGWKEYQTSRTVCGIPLPDGYAESARLAEPIFTPATKAEEGHDENIPFATAAEILGADVAAAVRDHSIALYTAASNDVATKGLILADTKFEFGMDGDRIILIDEALTPDSSRYWDRAEFEAGRLLSFDKQFVRDWLDRSGWNHEPPAPALPEEVVRRTAERYAEAERRLTGAPA
jgi:phosphoribosylaminoimidazole-succinocarboxamide synthase